MRIPLLHSLWFSIGGSVAIATLDARANASGALWGQWLAFGWFMMYGVYCVQNFLTCREVHCAVTGPGFLAAAIVALVRLAGIGKLDPMLPWDIFVATAVIGWLVEFGYEKRHGTTFLPR